MSQAARLLPLQAALLLAAHDPGSLSGRVKDPAGRPLAGILVRLEGGEARSVRTDAQGAYVFRGLAPGRYSLELNHPAFQGLRRAVALGVGHGLALDLTLYPAIPTASVEVTDKGGFVGLTDLDAPLNHLLGIADTASEGVITPERLERRAYQRPGELLEAVPGLLISQHSGEGKANQYYLRGFNLDHGTDLALTVAGMPVNQPTHAHGQGYADLSFLIPELVQSLQYRKGAGVAEEGDFAAAGSVRVNLLRTLDPALAQVELGSFGYRRALGAGSVSLGGGSLLLAGEGVHHDGPWAVPEDYRKANVLLGWTRAFGDQRVALTAMSYDGRWNGTDQVPQRAWDQGLIGRFGSLDPTDGGRSFRRSLSVQWLRKRPGGQDQAEAYVIQSQLRLYSNFTYFLDDPVRGDQFEQFDRRVTSGFKVSRSWDLALGDEPLQLLAGLQARQDLIPGLGLYHTQARARLETLREDQVKQSGGGLFLQAKVQWSDWARATLGLRGDRARFEVRAGDPRNGGTAEAGLFSPKLSLAFGPWRDGELYLAWGEGFHSNDARGTTLTVDPKTGFPVDRVTPLVKARHAEFGIRATPVPAWQTTVALWRLDLASELVFVGDAGTTEPSRPSRREGLEWSNEWQGGSAWAVTLDWALTRARFRDADPAGDRIPGAVDHVGSLGLVVRPEAGWQAGLQVRHVGSRALEESGAVRSRPATLLSADLRWKPSPRWECHAEAFNLANRRAGDIDYFYASRLQGEPAGGVADVHTHPLEPFSVRIGLTHRF
ncbi:MAG TPA: TonB-dependent receptor [Holophagaceae bacterium]|nr:TonB-dependent receptor [Holophagaceae bacterium]